MSKIGEQRNEVRFLRKRFYSSFLSSFARKIALDRIVGRENVTVRTNRFPRVDVS